MPETLHRLRCPHCGEAMIVDGDKEGSGYCLKCQRVVNPVRKPPEACALVRKAHLAEWHKRKGNTDGGIGR